MSRAEERFIVSTTDDIIVASTLKRAGDSLEITEVFDITSNDTDVSTKRNIPVSEVVSVTRESVVSEDVTADYTEQKEVLLSVV